MGTIQPVSVTESITAAPDCQDIRSKVLIVGRCRAQTQPQFSCQESPIVSAVFARGMHNSESSRGVTTRCSHIGLHHLLRPCWWRLASVRAAAIEPERRCFDLCQRPDSAWPVRRYLRPKHLARATAGEREHRCLSANRDRTGCHRRFCLWHGRQPPAGPKRRVQATLHETLHSRRHRSSTLNARASEAC